MSSFPLLFPWRALTVLPISNLLQRRGKKGMCYKRRMEGEKKREREEWIGGGEEVPGSAFFPEWRCTAICEETNTRMAIICPTSYVMWRLFTRHANLCGRWCMCFFSPVITSMELQSNALHLISSTGCAPRWVRNSLQDGFWHAAQPGRTSMNIIQCISPQPPTVNRSIEVDEVN